MIGSKSSNKITAANAEITLRLHSADHWPGVADFSRSAKIMSYLKYILVIGFVGSVSVRALDSISFAFHEFAVSHEKPVSFALAYPRGWKITRFEHGPCGEFIVPRTTSLLCSFDSGTGNTILVQWSDRIPSEHAGKLVEFFAAASKPLPLPESQPVLTRSGARGHLQVSEREIVRDGSKKRVTVLDFYFPGIQISVMTGREDYKLRAQLRELILTSLRI